MKKQLAVALSIATVVGMFGSVSAFAGETEAATEAATEGASGAGKKIGISMPTQSLERWNRDGSYLDEQFKKAGYATEVTYSDNDSGRQVSDIQNMIADKVDLLVIAAIDGEALNTVVDEAADANIPVIAYDRLIKNDNDTYYVSFDNYTVGTLQGKFIVDTLDLDNAGDKTYNMEITAGDPADNNATFFYKGAMDVLQPYLDKGTLRFRPARPISILSRRLSGIHRRHCPECRTSSVPTMRMEHSWMWRSARTTPPLLA